MMNFTCLPSLAPPTAPPLLTEHMRTAVTLTASPHSLLQPGQYGGPRPLLGRVKAELGLCEVPLELVGVNGDGQEDGDIDIQSIVGNISLSGPHQS